MFLLAVDKQGSSAVIETDYVLPPSCVHACNFLCEVQVYEKSDGTLQIISMADEALVNNLKTGINLIQSLPKAIPLYGKLGVNGLRFKIGYYVPYGFLIPSKQGVAVYQQLQHEDGSPVDMDRLQGVVNTV